MRRMSLLVLCVMMSLLGSLGVVAQDASPTPASSLRALGLPELAIRVYDDHFQVPGLVPAGRTLIAYENVGEESRHTFLLRLPDDIDLAASSSEGDDAPPPWFFESRFPGFPGETLPGETSYAVVDLTPGVYVLLDDFQAAFVVGGQMPAEAPPPTADATVELFDFGFTFPDTVAPGRQVWQVTNTGDQPHELLLVRSPEPVTVEQILSLLTNESEDEQATPVGGGPSFAEMTPSGGLGWLSPGGTAWTEVDLVPGTYIALCFVFDPETGLPHVMMGMVSVFTVGEEAATPAS